MAKRRRGVSFGSIAGSKFAIARFARPIVLDAPPRQGPVGDVQIAAASYAEP